MSELAVKGCSLKISSTMGTVNASLQITNQPSSDIFVEENGVYFDKISVSISSATITATVAGTTGTGTLSSGSIDINGTEGNILNNSDKKAVQKGDKETKTFNFTFTTTSSPPSQISVSVPITVEITNAGQTDVLT